MTRKICRVFLDSNVVLSGLFSDKGAPRIILDILSLKLPFLVGVTGQYNLLEIERNVARKLPAALPLYKAFYRKMNLEIIPVPFEKEIKKYAGVVRKKDMPVLVSAIIGKADFFVTGDKKDFNHLKTKGGYAFKIVSPFEFVEDILPVLISEAAEKT
ncbi:MAG TPA: PIN domain-containing protein [Syntrophorhabdaceae bacterium]|nr:PIN domain-containing protein [Syntrophorhabdaceae bacterium]HQM82976.1 PIN domain-containing protein [Syntrophorhabdaceae bacterium]